VLAYYVNRENKVPRSAAQAGVLGSTCEVRWLALRACASCSPSPGEFGPGAAIREAIGVLNQTICIVLAVSHLDVIDWTRYRYRVGV
jgi:hypothetical protein